MPQATTTNAPVTTASTAQAQTPAQSTTYTPAENSQTNDTAYSSDYQASASGPEQASAGGGGGGGSSGGSSASSYNNPSLGSFSVSVPRNSGPSSLGGIPDTTAPNIPGEQDAAGNAGQFTGASATFIYSLVRLGDEHALNALPLYANEETNTFYQQGKDIKTPIRFFKLVPVALKNCPKKVGDDACVLVAKLSDVDPKALGLITAEENGEREGASYNAVEYAIMEDEVSAEGAGDLKFTQLQVTNLTKNLNAMMKKGGLDEVLRYLAGRNYDLSILLRLVNNVSLKPEVRNAVLTQIANLKKSKHKKIRPSTKNKTSHNLQEEAEQDKAKLQKLREQNH